MAFTQSITIQFWHFPQIMFACKRDPNSLSIFQYKPRQLRHRQKLHNTWIASRWIQIESSLQRTLPSTVEGVSRENVASRDEIPDCSNLNSEYFVNNVAMLPRFKIIAIISLQTNTLCSQLQIYLSKCLSANSNLRHKSCKTHIGRDKKKTFYSNFTGTCLVY